MSTHNHEYDIIFAGGGTTACVVAGRLAAADPLLKILVVEAGPHTQDDLAHIQPARYISHLQPDSKTVKFMVAQKSDALGGRAIVVPTGQCIGGGSSVNFAMYTRASASDYDDWATKYGNPGWSTQDLLPLLQKSETYQAQPGLPTHGYSGPIKVSYGGKLTNVGNNFLEVALVYDKSRSFIDDPSGLYSCNAYARWPKWINGQSGKRSDTAHHYLYTQSGNPNVEIVVGCLVKRVLFQGTRAVGIEYVRDPQYHPDSPNEVITANAKRLVVLSAGTFGSPAILERSGIGSSSMLERCGVKPIVDLPGVGENYQDHCATFPDYFASDESDTLDGIIRGDSDEVNKWTSQWLETGTGLMAHNGIDAGIKIRPTEEEVLTIGPAFARKWKEFFVDAPDKPILWLGPMAMLVGDYATAPHRKFFNILSYLQHPSARGHVHITSAHDIFAPLDFQPDYLAKREDVEVFRWGYKKTRELARRMKCFRGEYAPYHPSFPEGSAAACKADIMPVAIDAPDIAYTEEDDRAIERYLQQQLSTTWHSLGTCAMKPRVQGGVVDSRLNVYGVTNLKVADVSIAPGNVAANTYSTALVIGEKAAVMIAEELGIQGV